MDALAGLPSEAILPYNSKQAEELYLDRKRSVSSAPYSQNCLPWQQYLPIAIWEDGPQLIWTGNIS